MSIILVALMAAVGTESLSHNLIAEGSNGETVSVATDKPSYGFGDTIEVTGKVNTALIENINQPILIQVIDPEGYRDRVDQTQVATDGTFTYSFVATGLMNTDGNYTVVAIYRDVSGDTTFQFSAPEEETHENEELEQTFVPFSNSFSNLRGAAINTDSGRIYIVNSGYPASFVSVLNATTLEQIGNVSTDLPYPSGIAVDESSNTAYLTSVCHCPEAAQIIMINGTSDEVKGSINAGDYPVTKLAVNPLANKIFAITNASFLSIIDTGTGNISKIRLDNKTKEDIATSGLGTYDVAVNPATGTAFVLDGDKNAIIAVRENSSIFYNTTIDKVPHRDAIDNHLVTMAVNPDTNIIYVVNEPVFPPPPPNAGARAPIAYIAVINGTSGKIISENIMQVGSFSFDLAVYPEPNIVYTFSGTNSFAAINGSTNEVIDEYRVPESFYPRRILVNPDTGTIYLVGSDGILKLEKPDSVDIDREITADEKQLLNKLDEAMDALADIPDEEIPIALAAVDDARMVLEIAIYEDMARQPLDAYEKMLKELLGKDLPIEVHFGSFTPLEEADGQN